MANERYFNIPVQMLRQLQTDRLTFFNNAFDYGLYNIAKNLEGEMEKRYKDSIKFLGVKTGNFEKTVSNAERLSRLYPNNSPFVGIEKEIFFDFYKNSKTEFEICCLAAFLGLRSIVGTKTYCKTNKQHIHGRMFGYVSVKDIPDKLSSIEEKYKIRWHMDKLLTELERHWHLSLYSGHQRGIYVSFDLELADLVRTVEKHKHTKSLSEFRRLKRDYIQKTIQSLQINSK
jgi:hypothetical protein